jgi:hypothetical protein
MDHLESMRHRAELRGWVPKVELRAERELRPGFDAAWVRPRAGKERRRRAWTWRQNDIALLLFRWSLDDESRYGEDLLRLRRNRLRALMSGACGDAEVRHER